MRIHAALDIGSSRVRCALGSAQGPSALQVNFEDSVALRLGNDVMRNGGEISRQKIEETVQAIARFSKRWRRLEALPDSVEALATSALREARNGDELRRAVWRETGIPIFVISGVR